MNEAEARALLGADAPPGAAVTAEQACAAVAAHCRLTVVTLGARGLWVADERQRTPTLHSIAAVEVEDSTGAGDFFAGGFLAAWLHDLSSQTCVEWGAAAAASVLGVSGTDLGEEGWSALHAHCIG